MTFNLADDYAALGDEILPQTLADGTYNFIVHSAEAAQTKAGKQAIKTVMKVIDGEMAGRTVPQQLTWSPESTTAARIFSQSLAILGASPEWIKNERPSMQDIAERIVGSTFVAGVKNKETDSGFTNTNLNFRRPIAFADHTQEAPPVLGATAPAAAPAPASQAASAAPAGFSWPGTQG